MFYKEQAVLCSDLLNQHTKSAHAAAEALLIPQLKKIRSRADYIALLQMFNGFFSPLYKHIFQYIDEKTVPDIHERRSSEYILHDLRCLGAPATEKRCTSLPVINNTLQAFGALYVLEGSTLGGSIIAKMLKGNTHLEVRDACFTFFNGYGENTMLMWNRFKESLNHALPDEREIAPVIASANETFEKLKLWIQTYFK